MLLTNKQTPLKTSTSLRCARLVGNSNSRASQTVSTGKANRFYWAFWNCFYAVANDQVGKARYMLPVFTGCEHGCQFGHPCSWAPVNTTREHGLSRAVNAGGVYWAGAFFIRMRRSTGDWWGETQPAVCRRQYSTCSCSSQTWSCVCAVFVLSFSLFVDVTMLLMLLVAIH